MAGGSINLAARVISDEHVDALRDFWNAIDRIQRETGQHLTLPCEADPDMWFSIDATGQAQAASACQECPVISACRDLADAPPRPREGIWAGRDYGRKYTALLCNDCGTGWWPLGRKEENSVAQLYCPACREKTPFRKRSRT